MPYLQLKKVSKTFEDRTVLKEVSLEAGAGSVIGILGPSGCGKTTLLRLIAGLEKPDRGEILLDGKLISSSEKKIDLSPEKRNTGMVFQEYALWPHMTVEQHIRFVLSAKKIPSKEHPGLVEKYLALVRLEGKERSFPGKLSGGEKQRVALARALAQEPAILLLDEPFSNLDHDLKEDLRGEVKAIKEKTRTTMLYVTHSPEDLTGIADRIAVMNGGRIVREGPAEDLLKEYLLAAEIPGK